MFFTFFVVLVITFFIDLIVVDPPYGLKKADWDDKPWGIEELYVLLANLEQLNSNVNATFVCFCSHEMKQDVLEAIKKSCFTEAQCVTWWKGNIAGHGNRFLPATEIMVWAWRGGRSAGYWDYSKEELELRNDCWKEPHVGNQIYKYKEDGLVINPAQKPQGLLRRIISHHSPGAGLVLDLCAGSHAMMMACISEGRSCISIESDERQHNAAVQIIQAKIDSVVSANEEKARRKDKEDIENAKKAKEALTRSGEDTYRITSLPLGHSKRAGTFVSAVQKRKEREEATDVEEADAQDTCTKCGKGPTEKDALVKCFKCMTTMHEQCHWSTENPEVIAKGMIYGNVVFFCKRICWTSSPMSTSAQHTPATAPADNV